MDDELKKTIEETVDRWFMDHIHGSCVGHSTEHYNHVRERMQALKDGLALALAQNPL